MLLKIYNLQRIGKNIRRVIHFYYQQHWEGEGGYFLVITGSSFSPSKPGYRFKVFGKDCSYVCSDIYLSPPGRDTNPSQVATKSEPIKFIPRLKCLYGLLCVFSVLVFLECLEEYSKKKNSIPSHFRHKIEF